MKIVAAMSPEVLVGPTWRMGRPRPSRPPPPLSRPQHPGLGWKSRTISILVADVNDVNSDFTSRGLLYLCKGRSSHC